MKEMRDGDEKWKLVHLGPDSRTQKLFTERVAPLARMKAAALDPWNNLNVDQVQAIVNEVYGANVHKVAEDGPWVGLVHRVVGLTKRCI